MKIARKAFSVRIPVEHADALESECAMTGQQYNSWIAAAIVARLEKEIPGYRRKLIARAINPSAEEAVA